jgi:hypothetical protein
MTLDDLLKKFESPIEAATVAKLGRTAAWHWFAKGEKRSLPSVRTLVMWSNHFGLTNDELGSVIRDQSRLRSEMHQENMRQKREERIKKRHESAERSRELRRERAEERRKAKEAKVDLDTERQLDWEEKEKVLEYKRLEEIIKENLR